MKIGPFYYPERMSKQELVAAKRLAKKAKKRNADIEKLTAEHQEIQQFTFMLWCHSLSRNYKKENFLDLTDEEIDLLYSLAVTAALSPYSCPSEIIHSSKGSAVDCAIFAALILDVLLWKNSFFDSYGTTNSDAFISCCLSMIYVLHDIPCELCCEMLEDRGSILNFRKEILTYQLDKSKNNHTKFPFKQDEILSALQLALKNDCINNDFCFLAKKQPPLPILGFAEEMRLQRDTFGFLEFLLTFEKNFLPAQCSYCKKDFRAGMLHGFSLKGKLTHAYFTSPPRELSICDVCHEFIEDYDLAPKEAFRELLLLNDLYSRSDPEYDHIFFKPNTFFTDDTPCSFDEVRHLVFTWDIEDLTEKLDNGDITKDEFSAELRSLKEKWLS